MRSENKSENESEGTADPSVVLPAAAGERWFLPRQLAGLALDYLRWTQMLPMIAAWTFFGLMIAALLLTNFQDVAMPMTERLLLLVYPVINNVKYKATSRPCEKACVWHPKSFWNRRNASF